jgi:hypothetical protein
MAEYFSTEGGHLKRTPEGLQALQDELKDLIEYNDFVRSLRPNKGNKMNERTDAAFQPMDKQPDAAVVHSDGTISVPIVEGDTFIDGVRQPKRGDGRLRESTT